MGKIVYKKEGWRRILLIIVPYFFIVGMFGFLGSLVAGLPFTDTDIQTSSFQELIISLFDFTGTFLVLWLFMKYEEKKRFIDLGFQTKNRLSDLAAGFSAGSIIMIMGFVLLVLLGEINFLKINFNFKELIIVTLIYVIVAIVEEMLFRGYILRNLMISFNRYVALIVSSILFALMHGFNPNISFFSLFDLFLAGMALGMSYLYTKNLWFPIAMHFSWNLAQSLLGFNVSGIDTYSIIEFKITEINLINGGNFGFEGSYLSIIAEVLTIIGIGLYYNRIKKSKVQLSR